MNIFLVQHLHTLSDGIEDIKLIGVYDSEASAIAAIGRLKIQPGFIDFPEIIDGDADDNAIDGFYIDQYELNKDYWPEGFVSV